MFSKKQKKSIKRPEMVGVVYRNLATREWARKMLFLKLNDRYEDADMLNSVLDEFEEEGLLDDKRFAECFIRDARDFRGYGPLKTQSMLSQKGVDSALFMDYLASDHPIWLLRAIEQRNKRFDLLPAEQDDKAKQYRFMQQRGFTSEQIAAALKSTLFISDTNIVKPEEEVDNNISIEEIKKFL